LVAHDAIYFALYSKKKRPEKEGNGSINPALTSKPIIHPSQELRCPSFHPCKEEWLYKIFIQHGQLRDKYPLISHSGIYIDPMFIRRFSKVSNNWFYYITTVLRKTLLSTLFMKTIQFFFRDFWVA
jgi:hypothetical protein